MSVPQRRSACPGLSAPMSTGDGLLVRFVPVDRIPLAAFVALCAAARAHGNGAVEITSRGSLQLRGLKPHSAPRLESDIAALDIAAADGVPVIADPLADHPAAVIDTGGLAAIVRRTIADAKLVLAPKVSVIIDGGDRLHLDALAADVRLRVIGSLPAPRLHVAIGGDAASAAPLGSIAPDAMADVARRLLATIAAQGCEARAVDLLKKKGIGPFRSVVHDYVDAAPPPPPRVPAEAIGRHPLRDGSIALGIALAFGHAQADALEQLARIAAAYGASSVRPAPGRALLLIGVTEQDAAELASVAEPLGFVVSASDPRRRVAACPGKPACASGLIAARSLAAEVARSLPPARATPAIHISGCAKGCAHPAPAALTVVGTERGCGIVRDGTAGATPRYHVEAADLAAEVARIAVESREAVHG